MRIQKRESATEKRVLAAMILDKAVLGPIAAHWDHEEGMFRNKWANLIGRWAVKHYDRHENCPNGQIQSYFERWAERGRSDDATVRLVESFLGHLSEDFGSVQSSPEYMVDLAMTHFNLVRIQKAMDRAQHEVDEGNDRQALEMLNKLNALELGPGASIDVLRDPSAMDRAFAEAAESIVTYDGALGNFFKGALTRSSLVSYMGTPGRGKTWWLIDLAWRAMLEKRRVAFFQIGDLSEGQIMRRFGIRAAKRPMEARVYQFPLDVQPPAERSRKPAIEQKRKQCRIPLTKELAKEAMTQISGNLQSEETLLKLSCWANNTISIHGIHATLDSWARNGWTPDVLVIDYADLLMPISRGESWDQVSENWKYMRTLSEMFHCCLATATQANASGLDAYTLEMKHFSGGLKKMAHATCCLGINQTSYEKTLGVFRLNWIKLREANFDIARPCYVAGCLDVGNPAVCSSF